MCSCSVILGDSGLRENEGVVYVVLSVLHVHSRTDGSPLPSGAILSDNVLIIPSPVPADSGDYICFSGDANFTFSLFVDDPPTVSPTPSMTPVPEGELRSWGHSAYRLHDYTRNWMSVLHCSNSCPHILLLLSNLR